MSTALRRTPFYRVLYIHVLIAVAVGVVVGAAFPISVLR